MNTNNREKHPPRLPRWIISRLSRLNREHALVDAIEIEYLDIRSRYGVFPAWIWYWYCALETLYRSAGYSLYWSYSMIKNYIKIALRNIRKNRMHSLLNMTGLTVSLAAFIMIGTYILHELSYDRYHEHADRIFAVAFGDQAVTPNPLAEALMQDFPEVETATRLVGLDSQYFRFRDGGFLCDSFAWADERLFDVFSFPLIAGDRKTALKSPNSLVISESTAGRYFGGEDPLGKILQLPSDDTFKDFMVTGVMKDIPDNSYIKAEIFGSLSSLLGNMNPSDIGWGNFFMNTFFLLREGGDPAALQEKYSDWLLAKYDVENGPYFHNIALTDMHLRASDLVFHFVPVGSITTITIFSAVALFILLISCVNYINLSTAQASKRIREVGIRKVVGAHRSQLIKQFLSESILLTCASLAAAVLLAYLLFPPFNNLVDSRTPLSIANSTGLFLILAAVGLVISIGAGIYPAFFVSRFNICGAVRGAPSSNPKNALLRNVLVVFQFAASIFLIIGTFVTAMQLGYIRNTDLGFSKDHIVLIDLMDPEVRRNHGAVKRELLQHPGIEGVTISTTVPMQINWHNSFLFQNEEDPEENIISCHYSFVGYDYVDLFGLEIVQGRNFKKELDEGKPVYIINEHIAKELGWEDPVGREYTRGYEYSTGQRGKIVGVVKDFHSENMHIHISPVTLCLRPGQGGVMSVKVNAMNVPGALSHIERVWDRFAMGYPFDFAFMDDRYDSMYRSEIRLGKAFNWFGVLAIFICCLGLFGLVSFTAEQSTKEIGIRKVLGASGGALVHMFTRRFLIWVVLSNVIAWPCAYIMMTKWLQTFAYRIKMGWPVFLLGASAALAVAFLTVIFRTLKAVRANPVDSLRYE